jgi:phosphoglycolate phosphatase
VPAAPRKPDPTVALELSGALGLAPADVAFVGDTAIDVETALRAGMHAVGVAWGFRPEADLRAAGARIIVRRPEDLPAVLAAV